MFNTIETDSPVNQDAQYDSYKPIITIIIIVICMILFISINLNESILNTLYPSDIQIFEDKFWSVITSNFIHIEIWHIFFNLSWFWVLSKKVEYENSRIFYFIFIISSAIVSSISQIAFSSSSGIGLSGVVYALFGFLYLKGYLDSKYKGFISQKTAIIFLAWLVICIVITLLDILPIGNAAHIGGLLWGFLLAYLAQKKLTTQWVIGINSLVILTTMIFLSPFSVAWLSYKAYHLHNDQKYNDAVLLYKEILKRDSDNLFAKENLKVLEAYQLNNRGILFYEKGNFDSSRKFFKQVLQLDSTNEIAKKYLELLK
jgi:GlpG protein